MIFVKLNERNLMLQKWKKSIQCALNNWNAKFLIAYNLMKRRIRFSQIYMFVKCLIFKCLIVKCLIHDQKSNINASKSKIWSYMKYLSQMFREQTFDEHIKKQIRRFIKLYAIKISHFNHSMRIESIFFIFASLNFAHRILQSWNFEKLNMLFRMWFWIWCVLIFDIIVKISVLTLFFK